MFNYGDGVGINVDSKTTSIMFEAFMEKLQELAEKHHLVNANGALSQMVEIMQVHLAESGQPEVTPHNKVQKVNA